MTTEAQFDKAAELQDLMIQQGINKIQNGMVPKPNVKQSTICEDCEEEIGKKRLELAPYATKCVDCQSIAETKSKHFR